MKVLVFGYGAEGKSSSRWIKRNWKDARVSIFDEGIEKYNKEIDWEEFDVVVKSAGISYDKIPKKIHDRVTSNTRLFFAEYGEKYHEKLIGITGTKGKSTTTKLTNAVLKKAGKRVKMGGNYGVPLLDLSKVMGEIDYAVIELSSYQLEDFGTGGGNSPKFTLLTNLKQDHLDRHKTKEKYYAAKANLWANQSDGDVLICKKAEEAKIETKGEKIVAEDLKLGDVPRGVWQAAHWRQNFGLVLSLIKEMGIEEDVFWESLKTFKGLPHRTEKVAKIEKTTWWDDSISTTPDATIAAINAIGDAAGVIMGGQERNQDFSELIAFLQKEKTIKVVVYASEISKRLTKELTKAGIENEEVKDIEKAVEVLGNVVGSVILSPGAPSFDTFKNYIERGKVFKAAVKKKREFVYDREVIPTEPGVYLYYGESDELLYVGKAKHLRNRVNSYFNNTKKSAKTELLVKKIRKIETRVVKSEAEALILENNLVKAKRPRFNVLLRDDKTFMYLQITNEKIPKMKTTRRIVRDGSFYAGPKTSSKALKRTMSFCQKLFKIRTCKLTMNVNENDEVDVAKNPEKRKLPCMDFHLKKCLGPCSGDCSVEEYKASVTSLKRFLRGDTKSVINELKEQIEKYAEEKKFEAAAKIRDLLLSVQESTGRQRVEFTDGVNRDFIGMKRTERTAFLVRAVFRGGKWIDVNEIAMRAEAEVPDAEVMERFLVEFYEKVDALPKEVCIGIEMGNTETIEMVIEGFFDNESVKIINTQKGEKRKMIDTANRNAELFAQRESVDEMSKAETFTKSLPELAKALHLKEPPHRIECYDVSHLGGTNTVASMVVFVDGEPKKSQYRRFKIKTLPDGKIDDFASMKEVLQRRFMKKGDEKFADKFPHLVVIDGGKGQVSAVMKAVAEVEKTKGFPDGFDPKTQIIGLAKREEEIFRVGQSQGLLLGYDNAGLKLLQRMRDEAHRFAVTFNRSLRSKAMTKSWLDDIDGIGGSTRKRLIKAFGSGQGVRQASESELAKYLSPKQLKNLMREK